jgi:hypothetical protein
MKHLKEYIGQALKEERLKQNLVLRDLVSTANVSLGYLSEVERGKKELSSQTLNSISSSLDLSLSELLLKTLALVEADNKKKDTAWH